LIYEGTSEKWRALSGPFTCSSCGTEVIYDSGGPMQTIDGSQKRGWNNESQARQQLFRWIAFYNHRRRHSAIGFLSPTDYETRTRSTTLDTWPRNPVSTSLGKLKYAGKNTSTPSPRTSSTAKAAVAAFAARRCLVR
jgi:hypothetical protein